MKSHIRDFDVEVYIAIVTPTFEDFLASFCCTLQGNFRKRVCL